MSSRPDPSHWYQAGLHFACTQCGNCCTGAPGYVFATREEIRLIADFLGRPGGALEPHEVRRVGRRLSLTELPNGDCIFLRTEKGRRVCGIYPVRPLQCRTWPFWDLNLRSPVAWRAASENCPGMNNGRHYPYVRIEHIRTASAWKDLEA
jgi:Fe-S-cluster containining protein